MLEENNNSEEISKLIQFLKKKVDELEQRIDSLENRNSEIDSLSLRTGPLKH